VAREGTKKTVFTNFADLCKAMNRQQASLKSNAQARGKEQAAGVLILPGHTYPDCEHQNTHRSRFGMLT
jgi:translation initiation factor 2 subunit 2